MEISQGNSLFSYLYLKLSSQVSVLSYPFFSPKKSENKSAEQALHQGEGWQHWQGSFWGKGVEGEIWCNKMCTHVSKC
jgi:hypothetical protein